MKASPLGWPFIWLSVIFCLEIVCLVVFKKYIWRLNNFVCLLCHFVHLDDDNFSDNNRKRIESTHASQWNSIRNGLSERLGVCVCVSCCKGVQMREQWETYLSIIHHVHSLENDMLREIFQEIQNIFHLDCVWQTAQSDAILCWSTCYDMLHGLICSSAYRSRFIAFDIQLTYKIGTEEREWRKFIRSQNNNNIHNDH